jgi:hypothetical protein
MKIRPVGAELFHAKGTEGRTERRTDMTKLIVTFRNFANASKNKYLNSGVPHKVCQTAGFYCMSVSTEFIQTFARLSTVTL